MRSLSALFLLFLFVCVLLLLSPPVAAIQYNTTVTYSPADASNGFGLLYGVLAEGTPPSHTATNSTGSPALDRFYATMFYPLVALTTYNQTVNAAPFFLLKGGTINVSITSSPSSLFNQYVYMIYASKFMMNANDKDDSQDKSSSSSQQEGGGSDASSTHSPPSSDAETSGSLPLLLNESEYFFLYAQPRLSNLYNAPIIASDTRYYTPRADWAEGSAPSKDRNSVFTRNGTSSSWANVSVCTEAVVQAASTSRFNLQPPDINNLISKDYLLSEVHLVLKVFRADMLYSITESTRERRRRAAAPQVPSATLGSVADSRRGFDIGIDPASLCAAPALYSVPLDVLLHAAAGDDTSSDDGYFYENNVVYYYDKNASTIQITHQYGAVRLTAVVVQCSAVPMALNVDVTFLNPGRYGSGEWYLSAIMYFFFVVADGILLIFMLVMIIPCGGDEKKLSILTSVNLMKRMHTDNSSSSATEGSSSNGSTKKRKRKKEEKSGEGGGGAGAGAGAASAASGLRRGHSTSSLHSSDPDSSSGGGSDGDSRLERQGTRANLITSDGRGGPVSSSAGSTSSFLSSSTSSSSLSSSSTDFDAADLDALTDTERQQRQEERRKQKQKRRRQRKAAAALDRRHDREAQQDAPSSSSSPPRRCGCGCCWPFQASFGLHHTLQFYPPLQWLLLCVIILRILAVILRAAAFIVLAGTDTSYSNLSLVIASLVVVVVSSSMDFALRVLVGLGWGLAYDQILSGSIFLLTFSTAGAFVLEVLTATCISNSLPLLVFNKNALSREKAGVHCMAYNYTQIAYRIAFYVHNAVQLFTVTRRLAAGATDLHAGDPQHQQANAGEGGGGATAAAIEKKRNQLLLIGGHGRDIHTEENSPSRKDRATLMLRQSWSYSSSSGAGGSYLLNCKHNAKYVNRSGGGEGGDGGGTHRRRAASTAKNQKHKHNDSSNKKTKKNKRYGAHSDVGSSSGDSSDSATTSSSDSEHGIHTHTKNKNRKTNNNNNANRRAPISDPSSPQSVGVGALAAPSAAAEAKANDPAAQQQRLMMQLYFRYRGMCIPFALLILWQVLFIIYAFTFYEVYDYYMEVFFEEFDIFYFLAFAMLFLRKDPFYA